MLLKYWWCIQSYYWISQVTRIHAFILFYRFQVKSSHLSPASPETFNGYEYVVEFVLHCEHSVATNILIANFCREVSYFQSKILRLLLFNLQSTFMIHVTIEVMGRHFLLIVIRLLPYLNKIISLLHIMKPTGSFFFSQLGW